jgi:predicted DCC family thiol-disulfide oxidoreductase YuxK
MEEHLQIEHLVLFDGECAFCNRSVQRIIKNDKKELFTFTPLESDLGKSLLQQFNIDPKKTDSIVYIHHQKAYIKSTAALRVAKKLRRLYPLLFGFIIIPAFIRNFFYDIIARNRYKWFGKVDKCIVPSARLRERSLS